MEGLGGFVAGVLYIQAHVGGHLIVAAAAGVQLFARFADALGEQGFHQHVDVLCLLVQGDAALLHSLQDIFKALLDLLPFILCQDAYLHQHGGMGLAALDILPK